MSHRPAVIVLALSAASALAPLAVAARPAPPPAAEARALSADRPDVTESPHTVEAGRFQLESDVVAWSRERRAPGHADSWSCLSLNLKLGLDARTDLQFVMEPLVFEGAGGDARSRGNGPLTLRLKRNLAGAGGEGWAVAAMPFVVTPSAGGAFERSGWEGGLVLPLARALGEDAGVGLMAEWDLTRAAHDAPAHGEGVFSATLSRTLAGPLGGFLEWIGVARPARVGGASQQSSLGFTLLVGRDLQFDLGGRRGLDGPVPRWETFGGFTWRR